MKNKFIVIEGIDGIGKDTIINHLKEKYDDIYFTREPGGTAVGEDIRNILLHTIKNIKTEILLFAAMRSEHIDFLQKILKTQNVVSSRYIYSGIYQKYLLMNESTNMENDEYVFSMINSFSTNNFVPDVVISCYLKDNNILMDRLNKSGREKDIIEQRGIDYYKYLNRYYENLKPIKNEYVYHLEVSGSIEKNNRNVDRIIDLHLNLG